MTIYICKKICRPFFIFQLSIIGYQFSYSQSATIYGKITDNNNQPIEDVSISLLGLSNPPVYTDKEGKYEYIIPAEKEVTVVFYNLNFKEQKKKVNLQKDSRMEISRALFLHERTLKTVEISDENERYNNLLKLDPKVINYIPSASSDFNTILFSQPGVSSRNELSSSYSVRGGNFNENLVYVNDIEVYRPFLVRSGQQEGLSFVNSDMVSSVVFSSGGFEAKYGDKMSSVLDIQYRSPRKFAGTVSGSLLGAHVHLEGCSPDHRFTWIIGSRYKTNQYVLNSLETKGDYRPSFIDVQSYLTYDLDEKWELGILSSYAANKYLVVPQNRETRFGTIKEAYRLKIYFDGQEVDSYETFMSGLSATWRPNQRTKLKFISSAFRTSESERFDIQGQYYIDQLESDFGKSNFGDSILNRGIGTFLDHARNDLYATVSTLEHKGIIAERKNQFLWGARFQHEEVDDKLNEWQYNDSAGYSLPKAPEATIDLQGVIRTKNELSTNRMMAYIQQVWNKELADTSRLIATIGIRANYWDLNRETVISPRLTLAYKPDWKRDFLFRASTGYYYQPPFYRELRDLYGIIHTDVKAQQSIHYVLAGDLNFSAWNRPFKLVSEIYYKQLSALIPYEVDNVRIRYYAGNNSSGYAAGADLKVNGEFVNGIESWASLSFLKTEEDIGNDYYYDYYNSDGEKIIPGYTLNYIRTDSVRNEPGSIPRPTDQRVMFSIFFQDYLPKFPDFKMHLNLIFGTGTPFGPPSFDKYKDTLRMPPYRRVDIGFSYQVIREDRRRPERSVFNNLKSLWISLEVFNLLQVNNTVSYLWVKDVTNRQYAIPNYLTARQLNLKLIAKF